MYIIDFEKAKEAMAQAEIDAILDGRQFTAEDAIDRLKSVINPEPVGRWIFDDSDEYGYSLQCSCCKDYLTTNMRKGSKFCPHCGVRMVNIDF